MKALLLTLKRQRPMLQLLHTNKRTDEKLYAPALSMQGHKKGDNTDNQCQRSHFDSSKILLCGNGLLCPG